MSETLQCQIASVVLVLLRATGHTNGQFGMTKLTVCLQICASKSHKTMIKRKASTFVIVQAVQDCLQSGVSCMKPVLDDRSCRNAKGERTKYEKSILFSV